MRLSIKRTRRIQDLTTELTKISIYIKLTVFILNAFGMANIMHGGCAQPSMGPVPLISDATERQKTALFIFSHVNLWRDIDDNPEGDARPRNGRLRAIVARDCQGRVNEAEREFDMFEQEISQGRRDLNCTVDMNEYRRIMEKLRSALNDVGAYLMVFSSYISTEYLNRCPV